MVIGLAMCTTAAFAQIQKFTPQSHKVNMNAKEAVSVDYKASIFTKDGENDTLATFTFADVSGLVYGDNGTVTNAHGNTTINGDSTMFVHNSQSAGATWNYISDSAYFESDEFAEIFPERYQWYRNNLRNYFGGQRNVDGDNGFMLMAMYEETNSPRAINAYFTLPSVATPENAAVIDVSLWQIYMKFNNDRCFLDYKLDNGTWKSWEINVRGVDVEVNEYTYLDPTYTMPIELTQQDSICLRVRWSCNSKAGGCYGYFWAIDDVRIISVNTPDRWKKYTAYYPDGAYGIMPQGMKIPLAWFSNVSNNGANDRTNIHTVVSVLDAERSNPTTLIDNPESGTLAAGQPSVQKQIAVDERNLFNLGGANSNTYWWGYSSTYGTTTVPNNYQYLPVETAGDHYVTVSATSTGVDPLEWDTISYKVVDRTGDDNTLFGYRWAHDNGLLANESRYSLAFSHDESDETIKYWDDSEQNTHYSETGYMVTVRFTTGSEIPVDPTTGEPWALLGVEIVPSTNSEDYEGMDETEIQPVVMTFHYTGDGSTANFADVATGVSTQRNHIVSVDDEANYDAGTPVVDAAGEIGADYNAVVIPFPAQPYLTPNLSYYIGYQLQAPGYFAAAATTDGYVDGENYVRYRNTEEYRNRAAQFSAYGTDVYLYDASETEGSIYAGMVNTSFPMIRAIVGPRIPRDEHNITIICDPQQEADSLPFTILNFDQDVICDETETFFEGSAATYYIVPDGAHGYVKEIVIDGVAYDADGIAEDEVTLPDGVYVSTNPYNYTDSVSGQIALWRNYYVVEFEDVQGGHDLSANGEFRPWTIGIDPVANECVLAVQPNPATSQVKVNISGVSGMVNCNIIDMSGRVVYNSDFNAEQSQVIDLNSFARGAYFVRVTNGTFSKIEKLIVR